MQRRPSLEKQASDGRRLILVRAFLAMALLDSSVVGHASSSVASHLVLLKSMSALQQLMWLGGEAWPYNRKELRRTRWTSVVVAGCAAGMV